MLEFVKKNRKYILIGIITILVFMSISKTISSCSHLVVKDLSYDIKETKNLKKLSMHIEKEAEEVLVGVAKKDGDWETYPLSQKFLGKYNSKDGIFPQYDFNSIDWGKMPLEQYSKNSFKGKFNYRIGNNVTLLKAGPIWHISIRYTLNNLSELDEVEIVSEKQTVDEYGDPVRDYDKEFTEKNIKLLTDLLFFDHWCWYYSMFPDRPIIRKEPISSNLASIIWKDSDDKSKGFIDFFDGLDYTVGNIYWLKSKTKKEAFNDNDLYCICKLYREGEEPYYDNEIDYEPIKNYLYKVNIVLDEDNKLDDIEVKFINEISNDEVKDKYTARLVDNE